jgi:hypothetical protein
MSPINSNPYYVYLCTSLHRASRHQDRLAESTSLGYSRPGYSWAGPVPNHLHEKKCAEQRGNTSEGPGRTVAEEPQAAFKQQIPCLQPRTPPAISPVGSLLLALGLFLLAQPTLLHKASVVFFFFFQGSSC